MQVYFCENEDITRNSSGGVMTYLMNLEKSLRQKGIEAFWVAIGKASVSNLISLSETPVTNLKYLRLLVSKHRLIPDREDCIIHCQRPDYLIPFLLMRVKNKLVCTLHGRKDLSLTLKKGKLIGIIFRLLVRFALKKADMLISVDAKSTQFYHDYFHIPMSRIQTIPIGIDFSRFYPMERLVVRNQLLLSTAEKYITYIGRLEYEKNLFFLLDAYRICCETRQDISLILIGAGSYQQALQDKAKSLSLPKVIFIGEINRNDVPLWINASDLLVLCSVFEGSPTVIREALACNVPFLSLDVGDAVQVLSRFGDEYIAEDKAELFAENVLLLLDKTHPEFRSQIPEYSSEVMSEQTIACYENLFCTNRESASE